MEYRVVRKQPNSKMCLVCGLKNKAGLHSAFYELDNEEVLAVFTPRTEHQGYPDRLHGGIAAAILDETIGRVIMVRHDDLIWGITIEFSLRFGKPVPLDQPVRVRCRITSEAKRQFAGSGEILLPDGTVAIKGQGRYLKMSLQKLGAFDPDHEEWRVIPSPDDPEVVDL